MAKRMSMLEAISKALYETNIIRELGERPQWEKLSAKHKMSYRFDSGAFASSIADSGWKMVRRDDDTTAPARKAKS